LHLPEYDTFSFLSEKEWSALNNVATSIMSTKLRLKQHIMIWARKKAQVSKLAEVKLTTRSKKIRYLEKEFEFFILIESFYNFSKSFFTTGVSQNYAAFQKRK